MKRVPLLLCMQCSAFAHDRAPAARLVMDRLPNQPRLASTVSASQRCMIYVHSFPRSLAIPIANFKRATESNKKQKKNLMNRR
uniref:Putative secreted protein n=1 Tax=Anopheles darlingi TaxID=43151 RepID=A0A2M4D7I2_ANODA